MFVYTIRKKDLYKSGVEPTCEITDITNQNNTFNHAEIIAKILMENQVNR